jgi:3',5'-cyclic-AMP phosphodiesterase
MTFRLAHISDSHLSADKPFFAGNFNLVATALKDSRPDLVVNTGDMSLDGAAVEGDLAEARRLHDAIALSMRFIPGNHDLGQSHDVPGAVEKQISLESRERYLAHFGADFWLLDVPGWRFIAVNSELLGSDLDASAAQFAFVTEAVAASEGRQLALFVHKPLFDASAAETAVTGRFVNPEARHRLLAAFAPRMPAVVLSGHVHQYRSTLIEGTRHVWAPSTGFIIPDARQPVYGEKQCGYVEHLFSPDGTHEARLVRPAGTQRLEITDFPEAYGGKL